MEYRVKKSYQSSYYEDGLKRCTQCEVFMKWNNTRCPCCGVTLRIKAHDAKVRSKTKTQKFIG
jgi:rRNA maturation endonuclease Nob1